MTQKIPGPDHPISIARADAQITVTAGGRNLATTLQALELREASYPPVYYIPRADADMSQLEASTHTTYCPYKGDCTYFSIPALGETGVNAVWSYEQPYAAMREIAGHLAFYPDRVKIEYLPL